MGTLHTDIMLQQARKAHDANQLEQARKLCTQLLGRDRNNADALILLGRIAMQRSQLEEAASHALKAAALRPADPQAHTLLAEILIFQGRFDDAVGRCDTVLRRDPTNPQAVGVKADAYEKSGQRDKARSVLQPLVDQGRETTKQALIQAQLDLHDRNDDAVIALTTRHIGHLEARGRPLPNLYFLRGRALERAKRFDEAFVDYEQANTAMNARFDGDAWRQVVDDLIEAFSPQRFANLPHASHGSPLPIFVLGMPRSGSTLVETILDAHPDVAAAGELPAMQELISSMSLDIGSTLPYPACIEDLDQTDVDTIAGRYLDRLREAGGQAQQIVDKYLPNYLHLGMLALLFPDARIVHCRRHPLDTCLSCFQRQLWPATHPYACDLGTLGVVYVAYERLMAHWRDTLKIPMLEVRYEAVVADQEAETENYFFDFCGLDFDERCLRFYEGDRVALTASYDQVNRPIYSSSVGRYRNFERHLGPLKTMLIESGWTEEAFAREVTA